MRDAQATEGSDTAVWIAARIVELYLRIPAQFGH